MARWIALALAGLSTLLGAREGAEAGLAFGVLNLVGLTMIFRPGWWTFWLPFGFWEQRASDSHLADRQGPVISFLGWIVLLLILGLAVSR